MLDPNAPNKNPNGPPRSKLLFVLLVLLSCLVFTVILAALWWVPALGYRYLPSQIPWILGVVFGTAIAVLLAGSAALLYYAVGTGRLIKGTHFRGILIKLIFPLLMVAGRMIGIGKDRIRAAFIEINNEMVERQVPKVRPHEMLLLLPHCLQFHDCPIKITMRPENCKRCGMCTIKDLVALAEEKGVRIGVATGGTLARRIVVQMRPRMIVAVACERDLSSGIQDSYPLPVYGVLNARPHGPCFDTTVDVAHLRRVMEHFLTAPGEAAKGPDGVTPGAAEPPDNRPE